MSYTRVNWQNSPNTSTPLSAENLNKMDAGIKQNADDIAQLQQHTYDAELNDTSTNAPQTKAVYEALQELDIETDTTLSVSGKAADAAATGEAVTQVKNAIRYVDGAVNGGETQVLPSSVNTDKFWNVNATTLVASLVTVSGYNACDPIDISDFADGTQVTIKSTVASSYSAAIMDDSFHAIDYVNGSNAESKGYVIDSHPQTVTFTKTANTKYIVSTIRAAFYTGASDFAVTGTSKGAFPVARQARAEAESIREDLAEYITKETIIGTNLFNPDTTEPGYLSSNAGAIAGAASGTYVTSDFIPVYANEPVIVRKCRDFLGYNSEKAAIASTYVNTAQNSYVYTPSADGYIRVSIAVADTKQVSYGNTLPPYEPYSEKIAVEDGIHLSDTMMADIRAVVGGGVLSGKKWVACGDSFTEGAYTASPTDDYLFTDEPYMGQKKVYPFFIGRRNPDMTVINEAISGSTMGAGENGINPFSGTRYTAIPADADYITLEFGINDSGHGVPIGTIDDADNTTFYGAWNVVLGYFAEHFPFAHIGIIVGPGMQGNGQQYANAEIAVAKKWGIPYLNVQFESGGGKIPLMLRTSCPDVSDAAKAACDARQFVNTSTETPNHHPNQYAHEFESTFIEAWLRTL